MRTWSSRQRTSSQRLPISQFIFAMRYSSSLCVRQRSTCTTVPVILCVSSSSAAASPLPFPYAERLATCARALAMPARPSFSAYSSRTTWKVYVSRATTKVAKLLLPFVCASESVLIVFRGLPELKPVTAAKHRTALYWVWNFAFGIILSSSPLGHDVTMKSPELIESAPSSRRKFFPSGNQSETSIALSSWAKTRALVFFIRIYGLLPSPDDVFGTKTRRR